MTNFEKIQKMPPKILATEILEYIEYDCSECPAYDDICYKLHGHICCSETLTNWLESEAEEE